MSEAIVLENVKKSFGSKKVLNGISGKVDQGKAVGLLGKNGTGKTTLMRILLDIIAADSGSISIEGRSPNRTGEIRKYMGYMPERPAFHEFLTLQGVLDLRARWFPGWDWEKAYVLAKEFDLDLGSPVKGASKGMLAKTAWICATAFHPRVLLLDEPTSGLDPLVRDLVLAPLVRELSEEGRTIFVCNHRMEELLNVLDEIWLLADGRIQGVFLLDELRTNSVRVTGRLRNGAALNDLPVNIEFCSGDLVRLMVFDMQTLEKIQKNRIFDAMELEPLPLETVLKVLLLRKEHHHVC